MTDQRRIFEVDLVGTRVFLDRNVMRGAERPALGWRASKED